jgi:hypothetical protein
MSHKRKDTLTAPLQWWKHLRDWKRFQNKRERNEAKRFVVKERNMGV